MANPTSYNPTYIATATTTPVATGKGVLHAVNITETSVGAITIYDNTAASGTILAAFKASIAENSYVLDVAYSTGLTIVTGGASKLTVSWAPM